MSDRKAKKPRTRQVSAGVDNLLSNSVEADKKYVAAQLDLNEEIAPVIASMIRDGEILRALERRKTQALSTQVGVKLGPRVKKFRNFSPRMWKSLLASLLDLETLDDFFPTNYQGEQMTDKQVAALCKFGLRVTDDTDVPKDYDARGYEGPLFCILKCRYNAVGRPLEDINHTNWDTWGWFSTHPDDITKVRCAFLPDVAISLGYTTEFLQTKTALKIIKNDTLDLATLVDEPSGFTQNLKKVLDAHDSNHGFSQTSDPFEYPDGASQFRGVVERSDGFSGPASPSTPASAGPSGAAAAAVSPAAPLAPIAAAPPELPAGVMRSSGKRATDDQEKCCAGKRKVLCRHGTLVTRSAISVNKEMKEQMDFYFLNGQVQVPTLTGAHVPGAEHLVQEHFDESVTFKILEVEYSSCDPSSAEHMQAHGNRCIGELLMVVSRGMNVKPGEPLHSTIREVFAEIADRDLREELQADQDTQELNEEESSPEEVAVSESD
ncbi:unnamed protein product [Prorocentrum cordatum]|uniref:DNA-directed RNA polymerase n=1 Tax=Prorocentrum cordatum TaxID=2364126 RepID=A0ABN9STS7_9DINO|nr:unnamed protein product [Polarella glacialis]